MRRHLVLSGALAALALGAGSLRAQQALPVEIQATPYAGYMLFGDMLRGPLGSSISSASGPLYGAQLGVELSQGIAVVGNIARADGDLQVGLPYLGGIPFGRTEAWIYDAGIHFGTSMRSISGLQLAPFAQLGIGAMRYDLDVALAHIKATNFTYNIGVGADIDLVPGLSLRFLAKDYIGKFDVNEATGLQYLNDAAGTDLRLESPTAHNFGITAGVKFAF